MSEAMRDEEREYILVDKNGTADTYKQFGDLPDETVVFVATSPEAALETACERYDLDPDEWEAIEVVISDVHAIYAEGEVTLGEEGLVVEREGDEPIAVAFADVSDEAVILGYVQRDGTVGEAPYGFPSFKVAHAAAGLAFAQSEHDVPTGCLYTGLAFAQSTFEGAEA